LRHCAENWNTVGSNAVKVIEIFIWLIIPCLTMALVLAQPVTETSTRNCAGGKGRRQRVRMKTSPPSVSRLHRKCGRFDVSNAVGIRGPLQALLYPRLLFLSPSSVDWTRICNCSVSCRQKIHAAH
jgi:hypothetical protein